MTYQPTDYNSQIPIIPLKLIFKLREVGPVESPEFDEKLQDYFQSFQIKRLETEYHHNRPYAVFEFNGFSKGTTGKEGYQLSKETEEFIFAGVTACLAYLYKKDNYDRPAHPSYTIGFNYSLTPTLISRKVKFWFDGDGEYGLNMQNIETIYKTYAEAWMLFGLLYFLFCVDMPKDTEIED